MVWDEKWGNGRAGEIRTRDLLHPKQARYQAAPQPDNRCNFTILTAHGNLLQNYYFTILDWVIP